MSYSFIILTESTADLPRDYCEKRGLTVLPFTFTLNGSDYPDDFGESMPYPDFYKALKAGGKSNTSMINMATYIEIYEKLLSGGQDVLHLAFSSGLSGSCENAMNAAREVAPKFPDRKLIVIDSLAASLGFGLFVHYAAEMRDSGKSIEETADWLELHKQEFIMLFTVDDLQHLRRGGRVSAAAAFVGGLMGIKPLLHVDGEGHLIPLEKIRGRRNVLERMLAMYAERAIDMTGNTVFLSHGDCEEDAVWMINEIRTRFKPKDTLISCIGPVIGSHSGPGTIALFFLGSKR